MRDGPELIHVRVPLPKVWILSLNRPEKRNALSPEIVEKLIELIGKAQIEGVEVFGLEGNGANFSAGFDLADLDRYTDADLLYRFIRIEILCQELRSLSAITVAFAHGKNYGAGVDIFAACRHRYAAEDAVFRMPGLQFELVLGSQRFAEIVGSNMAAKILESSQTFSADKAVSIGFIDRITTSQDWYEDLIPSIARIAKTLSPASRRSLYDSINPDTRDKDLALLVRSAAKPGLKDRILRYLDKQNYLGDLDERPR